VISPALDSPYDHQFKNTKVGPGVRSEEYRKRTTPEERGENALFDTLIHNLDRHDENILIQPDGVKLIDHGHSNHPLGNHTHVFEKHAGLAGYPLGSFVNWADNTPVPAKLAKKMLKSKDKILSLVAHHGLTRNDYIRMSRFFDGLEGLLSGQKGDSSATNALPGSFSDLGHHITNTIHPTLKRLFGSAIEQR
jgi:hypothetical protein